MTIGKYLLAGLLALSTSVPALCSNSNSQHNKKREEAPTKTKQLPEQSRQKKGKTSKSSPTEKASAVASRTPTREVFTPASAKPLRKRFGSSSDVVESSGERTQLTESAPSFVETEPSEKDLNATPRQPKQKKQKDAGLERCAEDAAKGDAEALKILEEAAQTGKPHAAQAQYLLGKHEYDLNMKREAAEKDPKFQKAFKWLYRATQHAEQSPEAQDMLGLVHLERKDHDAAFICFELAAQQGKLPSAMYNYGHMLLRCQGYVDVEKAFHWLYTSSNAGFEKATLTLGRLFSTDPQYISRFEEGCEILRRLAKIKVGNGHKSAIQIDAFKVLSNAYYEMGMRHLQGTHGFEKNLDKAHSYLNRALQRGHQDARFVISKILLDQGTPYYNPKGALEVLKVTAREGHQGAKDLLNRSPEILFELANTKASNLKTTSDFLEAIKLFNDADTLGHAQAKLKLMTLHYDLGLKFKLEGKTFGDLQQALEHFSKAKDLGHYGADLQLPAAHYELGKYYEGLNRPGEKQPELAFQHYTLAANEEHLASLVRLVAMHQEGRGTPRDLVKAHELCVQAAEKESLAAFAKLPAIKASLASDYREGRGVPRDLAKALELMREAAASRLPTAVGALPDLICSMADSMHENPEEALKLYAEARDLGSEAATQKYKATSLALGEKHLKSEPKDLDKAIHYLSAADQEGQAMLAQARYEKAEKILDHRAASIDEISEAIKLLSQAKELYPAASHMLTEDLPRRAAILLQSKNPEQAKIAIRYLWAGIGAKSAAAQYLLGKCFMNGEGVTKNEQLGVKHLNYAANQGHIEAKAFLNQLDFTATMNTLNAKNPDYAEAIAKLEQLAQDGHAPSARELPRTYYLFSSVLQNGSGKYQRNYPEAFKMLTKAAELKHVPAQEALGLAYFRGMICDANLALSHKWLTTAADQGANEAARMLPVVKCNLARKILQEDQPTQENLEQALELLKQSGKSDSAISKLVAQAQFRLAEKLIATNPAKAEELLSAAASDGHKGARLKLGEVYFASGDLTKVEAAVSLMIQSGMKSPMLPEAKLKLGKMYASGKGVAAIDLEKAKRLFQSAAEAGLAEGQYNYGVLIDGENPQAAFELYRQAAAQGHNPAKYALAVYHEEGKFVPRNTLESLRLALECGLPKAQPLIKKLLWASPEGAARALPDDAPLFQKLASLVDVPVVDEYNHLDLLHPALGALCHKLKGVWTDLGTKPIMTNLFSLDRTVVEDMLSQPAQNFVHMHEQVEGVPLITLRPERIAQVKSMLECLNEDEPVVQFDKKPAARSVLLKTQRLVAEEMNAMGYLERLTDDFNWVLPKAETIGQARAGLKMLLKVYTKALEQLKDRQEGLAVTIAKKASEKDKIWSSIYSKTETQLVKSQQSTQSALELLNQAVTAIKGRMTNAAPRNQAFREDPANAPIIQAFSAQPGMADAPRLDE